MRCVTNGLRRMKRRAAADITLSPDAKPPVINEAFDDSQAKPGQAVVAPPARGVPLSVCGVSIPSAARDPRGENF